MNHILSCRGTMLSSLSQQTRLRDILQLTTTDTRLVEIRTALLASTLNRAHHALQDSLSIATYLTDLIAPCEQISLNVETAIHLEAANAMWDQGEMASSIGMLKALDNPANLKKQTIPVGRSDLLSKTGHQVSVARLEKADQIMGNYLKPALQELKGKTSGTEAGQVFHQFAVFCEQQLLDSGSLEDRERLEKLSQEKRDEISHLDKLMANSRTNKARYKKRYTEAQAWLKLDEEELQRHISNRDQFLGQSLENYLLALAASDEHDGVALRFAALWLQHAEDNIANDAVSKNLKRVPSRKLAPLMNQFTSRLQHSDAKFQQLLFALVMRICTDHPYHGMYIIHTGTKSAPRPEDDAAISRNKSTKNVAKTLEKVDKKTGTIWHAIAQTNKCFVQLALEKDEQRYKSGRKVAIKDSQAASHLNAALHKYQVPPPTLPIEIAADRDYSRIPLMSKLEPVMSIASGVSTPKIITAIASNGRKFKQLVIVAL